MPIVAATGSAQAASPNRSRGRFAIEMQLAMVNAIKQAALDGVTSPDEIKARISAARSAVKKRHRDLAAAEDFGAKRQAELSRFQPRPR